MTKVRRIVDAILADVESGKVRRGERIESERQITSRFGVSLGTAQEALKQLQHLGVVSREHGRGTFVRAGEDTVLDARFIRFKGAGGAVLPIRAEIVSVRKLAMTGERRAFFGGAEASCVRVTRRLDVGGAFEMASEFFLGEADFGRLSGSRGAGLGGNIREKLTAALALPALRVEQSLSFVRLPKAALGILGLAGPRDGVRMEMRAYTIADRPLYLQIVFALDFGGKTLVIER